MRQRLERCGSRFESEVSYQISNNMDEETYTQEQVDAMNEELLEDPSSEWFWRANWCKNKGISPYDWKNWNASKNAFMKEYKKDI